MLTIKCINKNIHDASKAKACQKEKKTNGQNNNNRRKSKCKQKSRMQQQCWHRTHTQQQQQRAKHKKQKKNKNYNRNEKIANETCVLIINNNFLLSKNAKNETWETHTRYLYNNCGVSFAKQWIQFRFFIHNSRWIQKSTNSLRMDEQEVNDRTISYRHRTDHCVRFD